MKNKEKKTPKLNANEYILSSDAEAILYGLILVLISLIGFLNYGIIGEALTYIFAYLFGIFYISQKVISAHISLIWNTLYFTYEYMSIVVDTLNM